MSEQGSAHFRINDLSVDWDERPRRVEKPCVRCGKPTRGRSRRNGLTEAAHMACAFGQVTAKALRVYGKVL